MPEAPLEHGRYLSLLRFLDDVIQALEANTDDRTREQVVQLLAGLDAVHREGLERLLARVRDFAGDELVERLAADPVVDTFLGLYGFRELDVPEEESEPERGGAVGFVPLEAVGVRARARQPASGAGEP